MTPEQMMVTQLLHEWQGGNKEALGQLLPMIYNTLRKLTGDYMHQENTGDTLQATSLVNEAYLKLANADIAWNDRAHFIALAARAMRNILVDHAKAKHSTKRGSDASCIALCDSQEPAQQSNYDILGLESALEALEKQDSRKAKIVELHFFGGLTYREIAEVLKISEATINHELHFSKAWLDQHLKAEEVEPA